MIQPPSTTTTDSSPDSILLAITGATGALYGELFLRFLLQHVDCRIYLTMSAIGRKVIRHELKTQDLLGSLPRICAGNLQDREKQQLRIFDAQDFFAPIASGSSAPHTMVILPCSMGCIARIHGGYSQSLIERAADVMLKQRRKLVLCPRESPLSTLHLHHLHELSKLGAHIVPLMPAMYQKPQTMEDFVKFSVGRVCELIGLSHTFYVPWNPRRR